MSSLYFISANCGGDFFQVGVADDQLDWRDCFRRFHPGNVVVLTERKTGLAGDLLKAILWKLQGNVLRDHWLKLTSDEVRDLLGLLNGAWTDADPPALLEEHAQAMFDEELEAVEVEVEVVSESDRPRKPVSYRQASKLLGMKSQTDLKSYCDDLGLTAPLSPKDMHKLRKFISFVRATRGQGGTAIERWRKAPALARTKEAQTYYSQSSSRPATAVISRTQAMKEIGLNNWRSMGKYCDRLGIPKGGKLTPEEVESIRVQVAASKRRLLGIA